jgi:formate hydrogenlyase subunit 3/multisubunit Na+/H+ antiporter MnhD subunit
MSSLSQLFVKYIFFLFIVLGIIRESLLLRWCMLEVSTLLFIFLIFNFKLNCVNNLIHYYLVQMRASVGLFFRVLFSMVGRFNVEFLFLFLKLGVFPFHFWYFSLLIKLDWMRGFILIRPIKVISLIILFNFVNVVFFYIACLNLLFAVHGALFEKHLKMLLGLSSVFNMAWVLSRLFLNYYWVLYFLGYSRNLLLIVWALKSLEKETVLESGYLWEYRSCFVLGLSTFVLLGLPPFLGFFVKVLILRELVHLGIFWILLVLLSFIFVYIYIIFFFNSLTRYVEYGGVIFFNKLRPYLIYLLVGNVFITRVGLILYYLNNIKLNILLLLKLISVNSLSKFCWVGL